MYSSLKFFLNVPILALAFMKVGCAQEALPERPPYFSTLLILVCLVANCGGPIVPILLPTYLHNNYLR
jgi:hypothetical protein